MISVVGHRNDEALMNGKEMIASLLAVSRATFLNNISVLENAPALPGTTIRVFCFWLLPMLLGSGP